MVPSLTELGTPAELKCFTPCVVSADEMNWELGSQARFLSAVEKNSPHKPKSSEAGETKAQNRRAI